jgi:SAM-dependent methyltransferase
MPKPDLDGAYALGGAEETRKFYREWAGTYDTGFAETRGYTAPREVARVFRAGAGDNIPVLDIGAGTGLLGEALRGTVIDAIDLSPEMLSVAEKKGVYRRLFTGDLTGPLDIPSDSYGGLVSTGTFTHGHVGAVCLPELWRIAKPGALFVCTVIAEVLDSAGFGSALAQMVARGKITPVQFREFSIYDKPGGDHADDKGLIMAFRKQPA